MSVLTASLPRGRMPILGLGTWRMTGMACVSAVKKALDLGYRHIDTAEFYQNETETGRAVRASGVKRDEVFLTSKVWGDHFRHDDLVAACEASLKRLGTDYLDLYLLHYYEDSVPLDETLRAMKKLLDEGKIRNAGVSNFNEKQLQEAIEFADFKIAVNQVEFHPYLFQKELLDFCTKNNVHATAYCPVGRGVILNDPVLNQIAKHKKKTVAQVSLRWLLQHGLSVIPKASKEKHMRENMDVFEWALHGEEMNRIDCLGVKKRLVPLG